MLKFWPQIWCPFPSKPTGGLVPKAEIDPDTEVAFPFNDDIVTIAEASEEDFAEARSLVPDAEPYNERFKMALREEVMTAFDRVTEGRSVAPLADKDLPELFVVLDNLALKLAIRYAVDKVVKKL